MTDSVAELTKRIDRLERENRHLRGFVTLGVMAAAVVAGAGGPGHVAAQGGANRSVIAPFVVLNSEGKVIFAVREDGKAGEVDVFSAAGDPVVQLTTAHGGLVQVYDGAARKISLGATQGEGLLSLRGPKGGDQQIIIQGGGLLSVLDTSGKIRGQLGPGHVTVADAAGNEMGRMRAGDSGGSLDLLKGTNTYSVRMGTKEDGRSDVCAAGIKGDVCLGLLAAKTFTPY